MSLTNKRNREIIARSSTGNTFVMSAADDGNFVRNHEGGLIPILWFTYTGADDEVIPREATHIFVKARVVRREAFSRHPNIVEVICDEIIVEKIKQEAFYECPSLRRVIMANVITVEYNAFTACKSLTDIECGKLEIIGRGAFCQCWSLRSINLPSARIVNESAFVMNAL